LKLVVPYIGEMRDLDARTVRLAEFLGMLKRPWFSTLNAIARGTCASDDQVRAMGDRIVESELNDRGFRLGQAEP
jgi:hypothetical protein